MPMPLLKVNSSNTFSEYYISIAAYFAGTTQQTEGAEDEKACKT